MILLSNNLRQSCGFVAFLSIVIACLHIEPCNAEIAYHVARIEDDVLEVADECKVPDGRVFDYSYPSGRVVTVKVASEPVLTFALDSSVEINLVDLSKGGSPDMSAVVATLVPSDDILEDAARIRNTLLRCDVLVLIHGEPVDVVRRGTDWRKRLRVGRFASMEEAERAFSGSGASIRRETRTESELEADDAFWNWRRKKDLWDFHCREELRKMIRERDPDLYRALIQTPEPDCTSPPKLGESKSSSD